MIKNKDKKIVHKNYLSLKDHRKYVFLLLKHLKVLDKPKNIKILDLGTGIGDVYSILKKNGFQNTSACDIIPMFKEVKVFDFEKKFKYASNSFDLIICFDVIEHIKNNFNFVSEIHRILKPGGEIIIMTGAAEKMRLKDFYRSFSHYHPYTRESLSEGLSLFFNKIKVEYFKAVPIIWRLGYLINLRLKYNLIGRAIK